METVGLEEFDRDLRKILFELERKKTLLDQCCNELNESILKQQDLERQLINEKHKNKNDEQQVIILRNAAEVLEDERQKCNKELIKIKVQFELAVAERDSLRSQVRAQCLEIHNLKKQVDDFTSKHQSLTEFQKDISEQLCKMKISMNQINDVVTPLRIKQNELDDMYHNNNHLQQLLLSVKQMEKLKINAENQRDEIEKQFILKSAEHSKLEQLLKNSPFMSKIIENDKILDYWKTTCADLESHLSNEKDCTAKLTTSIEKSHENEEYLREKLSIIEEKLAKLEKNKTSLKDSETQTDYNDFIEIIDLVKSENIED